MTAGGAAPAIGRSTPRRDAAAKVTGDARYPADLRETDVLHARVVFSGRPHARMLAMDVQAAEADARGRWPCSPPPTCRSTSTD